MPAIQRLLDGSVSHEGLADDVDPALTLAAWVGLGLLLVEAGVAFHELGADHHVRPGVGLVCTWLLLLAGAALAVATRGFRRAGKALQSAQLGLLGAGVLVPMLWAASALR